jgi:orotate phosphoribosyltransferase
MEKELLAIIYEKGFKLSPEPTFKLASGRLSKYYIDCRIVTSLPKAKYLISQIILKKIADLDVVAIGGMETGAIPIADSVSYGSYLKGKEIKSFWVRKNAKNHGLKKWIEGEVKRGDRVIIVEDVITTGKSVLEAIQRCQDEGLEVVKVIALIDRQEENGKENIENQGISVETIFTLQDLIHFPPNPNEGR